jgi:hypothetical protein
VSGEGLRIAVTLGYVPCRALPFTGHRPLSTLHAGTPSWTPSVCFHAAHDPFRYSVNATSTLARSAAEIDGQFLSALSSVFHE